MVLAHFDGQAWSVVDPVGSGKYSNVDLLDIGMDGTVWVYLEVGLPDQVQPYLARLANDRWTVFSADEGVVRLVWRGESRGLLRAGHDGAVWVQPQDSVTRRPGRPGGAYCQGIRVFDGDTWRSYLDGLCVKDIEIGAGRQRVGAGWWRAVRGRGGRAWPLPHRPERGLNHVVAMTGRWHCSHLVDGTRGWPRGSELPAASLLSFVRRQRRGRAGW